MALEDLAEEERRRRAGPGGQGIGGAMAQPGQMLPWLQGMPQGYDYSGPGRAEAAQMQAQGQQPGGPSARHFARQGINFPGFENQNPIGGPNVAPGAENMQALNQPQGGPPPWAAAMQQNTPPPGQVRQMAAGGGQRPPSEYWRNYAPGSMGAAQLGFGTPQFGQQFGVGGAAAGRPPAPMQGGPAQLGGGQNFGGKPGGGAGPAGGVTPPGGGPRPTGGPGGGPGSGAVGSAPGGGGGGGRGGGGPSGIYSDGDPTNNAGYQGTARGGLSAPMQNTGGVDRARNGQPNINQQTGGVQNNQGQPLYQGPTANGPINQVAIPNQGNNNTPSEMSGGGQPNRPPRRNMRNTRSQRR